MRFIKKNYELHIKMNIQDIQDIVCSLQQITKRKKKKKKKEEEVLILNL